MLKWGITNQNRSVFGKFVLDNLGLPIFEILAGTFLGEPCRCGTTIFLLLVAVVSTDVHFLFWYPVLSKETAC